MQINRLEWEYCECGCHSLVAKLGPWLWSVYIRTRDDCAYLNIDTCRRGGKRFDNFEVASEVALEYANSRLADLQKEIQVLNHSCSECKTLEGSTCKMSCSTQTYDYDRI